jgi:hypothetical protein
MQALEHLLLFVIHSLALSQPPCRQRSTHSLVRRRRYRYTVYAKCIRQTSRSLIVMLHIQLKPESVV